MSAFRLRRVLSYIENNLSEDLSLAAIAAVSGLSTSHCQRGSHCLAALRGAVKDRPIYSRRIDSRPAGAHAHYRAAHFLQRSSIFELGRRAPACRRAR